SIAEQGVRVNEASESPTQPTTQQQQQQAQQNDKEKIPVHQLIRRETKHKVTVQDVWQEHCTIVKEYGEEAIQNNKTLKNRKVIVRVIQQMMEEEGMGQDDAISMLQARLDKKEAGVNSINKLIEALRPRPRSDGVKGK
ncbi:hypothetical protein DFQ26_002223, partial [Actinomortierella ambigua]